jgi:hypothetical protein
MGPIKKQGRNIVSGEAFCTSFTDTVHFTKVNSVQSELIHSAHKSEHVNNASELCTVHVNSKKNSIFLKLCFIRKTSV